MTSSLTRSTRCPSTSYPVRLRPNAARLGTPRDSLHVLRAAACMSPCGGIATLVPGVGLRFNVSGRWASERDVVALPVGQRVGVREHESSRGSAAGSPTHHRRWQSEAVRHLLRDPRRIDRGGGTFRIDGRRDSRTHPRLPHRRRYLRGPVRRRDVDATRRQLVCKAACARLFRSSVRRPTRC